MRFVMDERWWDVPFGKVNRLAVIAGHGGADDDASAGIGGGVGLVFSHHLADGPQPQHLGVHFGARHHESDDGMLRGGQRSMVADVRGRIRPLRFTAVSQIAPVRAVHLHDTPCCFDTG